MSILAILSKLGFGNDDDGIDGLSALQEELRRRERRLALDAEYGTPTVNFQGEPTAVFPVSLYHENEAYGATAKEFPLPDGGVDDPDAPLTQFLNEHGISSIDEIGEIEGQTESAALLENGHIQVGE